MRNLYADLSHEGQDVHGLTEFLPDQKPSVKILEELSSQANEHRLRTTLTHEYGHVKFHDPLWQTAMAQLRINAVQVNQSAPKCKRDGMINAPQSDWMEWQAGYVSGSILMPHTYVRKAVGEFLEEHSLFGPVPLASPHAHRLIGIAHHRFGVSLDAARMRLLKLGCLTEHDLGPSLF